MQRWHSPRSATATFRQHNGTPIFVRRIPLVNREYDCAGKTSMKTSRESARNTLWTQNIVTVDNFSLL